METKAQFLGHPVHQMLIPLPFGLLSMAVIFDVIHLITGTPRWTEVAYYMIGAGIVSGLVAAPFGLIDWLSIPRRTRAWRIGALHGGGNVLVLLLFLTSWWLRRDDIARPESSALAASFVGFALAGVTGWLGGELVDRFGVGVHDDAHLDAPTSLSSSPVVGRREHLAHQPTR
jgi:uncharacterized membrane protein